MRVKEEFERQWGRRENENDWRRSDKIVIANFESLDDTTGSEEVPAAPVPVDSLTVDQLMKDIPMNDSTMNISRIRLMEALHNAGIIYKDQLNETKVAASSFNEVVNKPYESNYKLLSAFELYKMYSDSKPFHCRGA